MERNNAVGFGRRGVRRVCCTLLTVCLVVTAAFALPAVSPKGGDGAVYAASNLASLSGIHKYKNYGDYSVDEFAIFQTSMGGTGEKSTPYTRNATVPNWWTAIQIANLAISPYATAKIYTSSSFTQTATSGELPLNIGSNNYLYVEVTAEDTTTKRYYNITVKRSTAAESDAGLASVAGQTINAASGDGTSGYPKLAGITVPNSRTSIGADNAVPVQSAATVAIQNLRGEWVAPGWYTESLIVGSNNHVYLRVTAPDGVTQLFYNITVTRSQPSVGANLISMLGQNITTTGGDGTPASPYTATITVSCSRASISLGDIEIAQYATAYFSSGGSYNPDQSATLNLAEGQNHVYLVIFAQNISVYKFYDITVIRQPRLVSVAERPIRVTRGTGTRDDPYVADAIAVSSEMASLSADNLVLSPGYDYYFCSPSTDFQVLPLTQNLSVGENQVWLYVYESRPSTAVGSYFKVAITRYAGKLVSVAGQLIAATDGVGTVDNPLTAAISVPNSRANIVCPSDLVVIPNGTVTMIYGSDGFYLNMTRTLNVGANPLRFMILFDDGTSVYYNVTVTRANPPPPANQPAITQSTVNSSAVTGENSITLPTVAGAEYSRDGTNWQDSPTFAGLSPDTEYTFYVRTKGDAAHSPSAPVTVTARTRSVQTDTTPPPPAGAGKDTDTGVGKDTDTGKIVLPGTKITKVTVGKRLAKITFKKVAKANRVTKYQLQYRMKGAKKWTAKNFTVKYTGATSAKVTVKKLIKGKRYQFRIRAWKAVGAKKYYAPWSAAKASGKVK